MSNWYKIKIAETVRIRDMYTMSPKSVYVERNPSFDRMVELVDKSPFSSIRMLKDKNGDVVVWDGNDGIHYQIAGALGLDTSSHSDGPSLTLDENYELILYNPPGPYSFNNFFGKQLSPIGKHEYLVVDNLEQEKIAV